MRSAEERLADIIARSGVDFTATLPCDRIKGLLEIVSQRFFNVPLTREEEGVGICAGAALAGKRPAMFIQNSGIGNMINALLSLTGFYRLPLAIFVSHRGVYKEKIAAQAPMGLKLPGLLKGAGIGFTRIDSASDLSLKIEEKLEQVYLKNSIHVFLLSPALWEGSELKIERQLVPERRRSVLSLDEQPAKKVKTRTGKKLDRYEILSAIWPWLENRAVVCNLGFPARELYQIGHRASHFYMLGSMGMATPIGLGLSLSSDKEVLVIDGDGSLLMNPGTLATVACLAGKRKSLTILAVDNGAYGSTGNQPTFTANCIDLEAVAKGFGLKTVKAAEKKEIITSLQEKVKGPRFIHALALPGNRDVPVIPLGPLEIRKQFMGFFLERV
ncbi:MAG: sulfopyruvate decarboxylase subunit alpha [Nitrospiraceae bacterium]|nr:sulfopyruvate decarboxylase subunit alpha [Nitrospiraceae bacterium]